jgi:hypothetical protein
MRVSLQRRKELNKRDELIFNLHISGYSYSEIIPKIAKLYKLRLTPARIGQILSEVKARGVVVNNT